MGWQPLEGYQLQKKMNTDHEVSRVSNINPGYAIKASKLITIFGIASALLLIPVYFWFEMNRPYLAAWLVLVSFMTLIYYISRFDD